MRALLVFAVLASAAAHAAADAPAPATAPAPAPRAVSVPVPVNPPTRPAAKETTAHARTHAAAVVGISGAAVNLVGYAALMGGAFLTAGYIGTGALLIPIIGMPVIVGLAVYIASTFVTDAPGALANTGGALLGHYVGLFLGLVSGIGAGIAYQAANKSDVSGNDFNVNLLTFGGVGALVGGALGGTVGTAVGGGAVAALTVGDE